MVTKDPREPKRLSHAEQQVMLALWACGGPATRHQIELKVAGGCAWADTTVLGFLNRLQEKGYVAVSRQANRNLYTPLLTQKEYAARTADALRRELFGGELTALVATLAATGCVSLDELDELKDSMDEIIMGHPGYAQQYDPWERNN